MWQICHVLLECCRCSLKSFEWEDWVTMDVWTMSIVIDWNSKLSMYWYIYVSMYLFIYVSMHLCSYVSMHQYIYKLRYLWIYTPIHLGIYIAVIDLSRLQIVLKLTLKGNLQDSIQVNHEMYLEMMVSALRDRDQVNWESWLRELADGDRIPLAQNLNPEMKWTSSNRLTWWRLHFEIEIMQTER